MVEHFHSSRKPGELIGRYAIRGRDVEMQLSFGDRTYTNVHKLDNVGLLACEEEFCKYIAFDSCSPKVRISSFSTDT